MDWQTYEEVVRNIYEALGSKMGVKIECYGSSCWVKGKSGVSHQIDVLTSHSDGIHKYTTAIECKYWKKKVNKDVVMKVGKILEDANINQGVIVSQLGFTEDAKTFAEVSNIKLVQLREHNYFEKDNLITKYYLNLEVTIAVLESMKVVFEKEDIYNRFMESDFFKGAAYEYNIYYETGDIKNVTEVIVNFLNQKVVCAEIGSTVNDKIEFPENTFIRKTKLGEFFPVNGLILNGYPRVFTKLALDYIENKVWLIMKLIFEKKEFSYSRNGEINELTRDALILPSFKNQKTLFHVKPRLKKFELEYVLNPVAPDLKHGL